MKPILLIATILLAAVALGPHCSCAASTGTPPPHRLKRCWLVRMTFHSQEHLQEHLAVDTEPNMWVTEGKKIHLASCHTERPMSSSPVADTSTPREDPEYSVFARMVEEIQKEVYKLSLIYIKCEAWLACRQPHGDETADETIAICKYLYNAPEITYQEVRRCLILESKYKNETTPEPQTVREKRSSESRPELVYTFIEQAVQPGAQVALKCSAVGEPFPRFRWSLDGQPIPAHLGAIIAEGRENGPNGLSSSSNYVLSTLTLTSARVEHGGRYECRATNNHGSVAHAARLNVYGPPYIRAMNPVKAVAGSEVTIWCPYYGFPIDSVKWEGGAGVDPRYQQMDGQLTITNVDRNRDKGGWTCSVLTPGGELARREVQVTVVSPPVLSPIVFPPGLKSGDRAQLTCTVTSGDMPVYFSWLKNMMPISSSLQESSASGGSGGTCVRSSAEQIKASKEKDGGESY